MWLTPPGWLKTHGGVGKNFYLASPDENEIWLVFFVCLFDLGFRLEGPSFIPTRIGGLCNNPQRSRVVLKKIIMISKIEVSPGAGPGLPYSCTPESSSENVHA